MISSEKYDMITPTNPVPTIAPPKEETQMFGAIEKITALYCRLSQEDAKVVESNSISNQRNILLAYARDHHFANPVVFVDDGYSGTDFKRPGFQKMLSEIEAGHVAVCITKDLSRLGRNSALVGMYINMTFSQFGVRYIAINDHYDTINPNSIDNDFAGIKNWFNEFYARDTSRKIRSVNKSRGESGIPLTTNVPYGYLKHPENKGEWIIDDEAAKIVKRIFNLCMEGVGPTQIAKMLRDEKIPNPTAYKRLHGINSPSKESDDPCNWNTNTVVKILERREYTGCTVNFKTYTNSLLDKKKRVNTAENRKVFYNTHPMIISEEVFEKYSRFGSSATGEPRQAKAVFSLDLYSVPIANRKCTTVPPATLKSGRIILCVPTIGAIPERVQHIL